MDCVPEHQICKKARISSGWMAWCVGMSSQYASTRSIQKEQLATWGEYSGEGA